MRLHHPLRSVPGPKQCGPDVSIRTASTRLMERAPHRVPVHLALWERRQVLSFHWSWFREVSCGWWTWWEEVEAIGMVVGYWGHWPKLGQPPMSWSGSSCGGHEGGCTHGGWVGGLLKICLESLDAIPGPSYTARVRRYHWGCNWAPSSSSRTVQVM